MDARRLQKSIAKKMRSLSTYLENSSKKCEKDRFMEKFMLCETACKEILVAYFKEKKKAVDRRTLKLYMVSIPSAMKKAGYQFDKDLLANIFGSAEKRGEKSAKKLRDGIAHSLCIEDIDEVFNRRVLLHQEMDAFLLAMRTPPPEIKKRAKKKRNIPSQNKAA